MNIKSFSRKEAFIKIIKEYVSRDEANHFFEELLENQFLRRAIQYECCDEFHKAEILQKKCEYCDNKIDEHEYYDLFIPEYQENLRKYNLGLINNYFSKNSYIVIKDLKENLDRTIPFVGAGISKTLGLPLWLELFKNAKKGLDDDFLKLFERRYEEKNIDKLVDCILEFNPLIQNHKDLKMKLIKPQVIKNFTPDELEKSILPKLLDLDSEYIITTNYDDSLEQCNKITNNGYDVSKNIKTFEGFENLKDEKYIFHLHGDINRLDSMVVTHKDYEELYSDEIGKKILTGLVSKYSMLFLGFSMNDQYFSNEFKNICDSNKGYGTNYMVLLNGNPDIEKSILNSNNVKFISILADKNENKEYEVTKQYNFLFDYLIGNIFD
ncbi:hypothetical protein RV15_GL002663 [Enterococcus silesiacus]|nr:hypothetical protein RV15_GL002663 [Enterococcus silesiacus]